MSAEDVILQVAEQEPSPPQDGANASSADAGDAKIEPQTVTDIENPPTATPRLAGTVSEMHVRSGQAEDFIRAERHNSDPITSNERTQAVNQHGKPPPRSAWEKFQLPTPWGLVRLPSVREEFFCQVCFENCDVRNAFTFTGNGSCLHKFCKDCLRTYVSVRIVDGQVRHPCPMIGDNLCESEATAEDIRALVDDETYEKYDRFVKIKSDENYRDCPSCGELVLGNRRRPAMTCPKCTSQFCFFHANAHPGESCRQFARRVHVEERASGLTISQITKKCPSCKLPTEKNGGCNHMTCYRCRTDWCWLCGRRMGDNHFEAWNIFGCPGVQMMEGWNGEGLWIFRVLYVPLMAMAVALGIAFGIPTTIIAGPFVWYFTDEFDNERWEKIAIITAIPVAIIMAVVLLGISCAWTAVAIPVCILLSPLIAYRVRTGTFGWSDAARWLALPAYVFVKQLLD